MIHGHTRGHGWLSEVSLLLLLLPPLLPLLLVTLYDDNWSAVARTRDQQGLIKSRQIYAKGKHSFYNQIPVTYLSRNIFNRQADNLSTDSTEEPAKTNNDTKGKPLDDDDDDNEKNFDDRAQTTGDDEKFANETVEESMVTVRDLIPDDWFLKDIKQASYTQQFSSTCGRAPRNPLTPIDNQSPYMIGGRNQVYGEWPMFARIRVRFKKRNEIRRKYHRHNRRNRRNRRNRINRLNRLNIRNRRQRYRDHFEDQTIYQPGRYEHRSIGKCSGVIISDQHVLTAAHCVHHPGEGYPLNHTMFTVFLGENNVDKMDDFEQVFKVTSYCSSKSFYDPGDYGTDDTRFDIAILTLDKKIQFNDYVQPVCLPYEAFNITDESKCYVVGVGVHDWDNVDSWLPSGIFPTNVQTMPMRLAGCNSWNLEPNDRSRFCWTKKGGNGDTCSGDSGGPVLCLHHKQWHVMGLVSFGSELCVGKDEHGYIAVYTRVRGLLEGMNKDCSQII